MMQAISTSPAPAVREEMNKARLRIRAQLHGALEVMEIADLPIRERLIHAVMFTGFQQVSTGSDLPTVTRSVHLAIEGLIELDAS